MLQKIGFKQKALLAKEAKLQLLKIPIERWYKRAELVARYHKQMIDLLGQAISRHNGWSMRKTADQLGLPLSQVYNYITAVNLGCGKQGLREDFDTVCAFIANYDTRLHNHENTDI